ncbi:MAG: alanine--tRNA ligase [Candidatus Woesearchaeota archaeon]
MAQLIPDKQIKKEFKIEANKNPEKYFPTKKLETEGFTRKKCKCGVYFWTKDETRTICGEPTCTGGFLFFDGDFAKKKLTYIDVWKEFSKYMKTRGYTPINRYSVVARWRDDTDFVQASIYNFQPYVVSGEVDPPANPLVVPQFSLRFNDVDNVGITMSHHTGFVMIGQHAFMKEEDWDQEKYFKDLLDWFLNIIGIPEKELIIQEDAWAGGGNFGSCMEFFCKGAELANQVYMLFEQTPEGSKPLKLKVLDMGMGHERVAWFTQGTGTIYDAVFPRVIEKLIQKTGVKQDQEFLKKYLPHGSLLNLDETENMEESWKLVAKKTNMQVDELKQKLIPLRSIYSIAEHARSLLVAISDGAMPSNVKGGYNLRMILRRALRFIDENNWDINLSDVCEWHAEELRELFPELQENLNHVKKILEVEKQKYQESQDRNKKLVEKLVQKPITTEKLIEVYDSNGVDPETIKQEAKKQGITITIPENFYSLVTEKHDVAEKKQQTTQEKKLELEGINSTKILYYDHYDLVHFKAHVIKIIKEENYNVILDSTAFYPTSGGQIHDLGTINNKDVINIKKQGSIIIHELKEINFKEGDQVECKIDFDRRLQLAQHHTATHLLTGSARRILGNHIWQAGAAKTLEKSRLDITHYEQLTPTEIKQIENLANEIVEQNRPIYKTIMKRNIAEAEYGVRIYQGGAVPGRELRIVNVLDFDTEACGGTHLDVTGDIGRIKIIKTSKIQDGVIRLEFIAGGAAEKYFEKERTTINKAKEILSCTEKQIPSRAQELFDAWKQAKKGKLKELKLKTTQETQGDAIDEAATNLKTQPEHLIKTLERFKQDIEKRLKSKKL